MSEEYTKSKELGHDYLNERYLTDDTVISFIVRLEDVEFNFDVYMKQCAKAFYDIQTHKEYKNFIKENNIIESHFYSDVELELQLCSYETEDEFIERINLEKQELLELEKRRENEIKMKRKKDIKYVNDIFKSLSTSEQKKIIQKLTKHINQV